VTSVTLPGDTVSWSDAEVDHPFIGGDARAAWSLLSDAGLNVDLHMDSTITVHYEAAIEGWVEYIVADLV